MARPTKKQQRARRISEAVSKFTPEIVKKLEEAFAIDSSVEEACFYADISRQTFYDWIKKNKEFSDRIEALRQKPVLKARQTIVRDLDNVDTAKWYAERKRKNEFSNRQELTGKDGGPVEVEVPFEKYIAIVKRESRFLKNGGKK